MIVFVHKAHETLMRWQRPGVGRLLSPRHFARVADTAAAGMPWAADNDCFQGLDAAKYRAMLDAIRGVEGCAFVVAPDVVGDWKATRQLWDAWIEELLELGLPLAYVLQDGQPNRVYDMPWGEFEALFIGGGDEYKLSDQAHEFARDAKDAGLWVHMGRVNSAQRMMLAKSWGCDSIDGTSVSAFTDRRLPERLYQANLPRQLNLKEIA